MDLKTILIQHVYPNRGYLPMLLEHLPRHVEYCQAFEIDYEFFMGEINPAKKGGWDKVSLVKEALLSRYDLVIWLDADAIIRDTSQSLKEVPLKADQIGAVWFPTPGGHYNVGVLYFRNGPRVRKFVDDWNAGYPGENPWHEQYVFNAIQTDCIVTLPAVWNASRDHNFVQDAIIAAGHGIGPLSQRMEFLRSCL